MSFFEAFTMPFVNRKLEKKLDNIESHVSADIKSLSDEDIKRFLDAEWVRAKELDEKLTKLTVSLSVALTIGGLVAKTIVDGLAISPIKIVVLILLALSMVSFLYGAVIGFRGLKPKRRFGYGASFMASAAREGDDGRKSFNFAVAGFEVVNMVRANEASASVDHIRNGIILFAISVILSFAAPIKQTEQAPSNLPTLEFVYKDFSL